MKRAIIIMLVLIVCQCACCETSDFLSDEKRFDMTQKQYNDVDYIGLRKCVDDYILSANPTHSDSVYRILEILNETSEAINSINENVDDFDGSRSFTLDGVEEINENYCVVPGYDKERWLTLSMGFISDEWVFFDNMALRVDGEVICEEGYDSDEVVTDVLDDGRVMEMVHRPIDLIEFSDAEKIFNSERTLIRFSNSKTGAKFDHVLSAEEKASILHCYQLLKARTALSKLYWAYSH